MNDSKQIRNYTASTQTALHCAPLKSSVHRANSSKFTSLLKKTKINKREGSNWCKTLNKYTYYMHI